MGSVLDAIVAGAARSASDRQARDRIDIDIERLAATAQPDASAFTESLAQPGLRVIAECKRRSPSRGILRRDYDPAAIASSYAKAGAAAISVLTEPSFFDGHLDHLRGVRASVRIPLLRKDFIVSEFQIIEARAAGADAVLLIVAALDDELLKELLDASTRHGLAALVEAHSVQEAQRALDAGATILGVNSRDLRTLAMNPKVFDEVAAILPKGTIAVAESGISAASEAHRLRSAGYSAFLIGERFMTAPDPGAALADFVAASEAGPADPAIGSEAGSLDQGRSEAGPLGPADQ